MHTHKTALFFVLLGVLLIPGNHLQVDSMPRCHYRTSPAHSATALHTGAGVPAEQDLPWLYDPEFLGAVNSNKTPVFMAAFQITLQDPIESEDLNIALAAKRLTGIIVPPGTVFSINQTLGPYTEENGYAPGPNYINNRLVIGAGGGVCTIASMLYNLAVLSNLPIIYRRAHSMIVPYVPLGQDATISYNASLDFRFRNNTSGPILIWSHKSNSTLYMAFYGQQKGPAVAWGHEILSYVPAPTVTRYNPNLPVGHVREVAPGFDGYTVRSWVHITYSDGQTQIKSLGISHYTMAPRVVEHGPRTAH